MSTRRRALLVEDSNNMAEFIRAALPDFAWQKTAGLDRAFAMISANRYELIIIDLALEDSTAENTLARLAGFVALAESAGVIAMTGLPLDLRLRDIPADAVLNKPFTIAELDAAVSRATAGNSPKHPRAVTGLLLAATRAALGGGAPLQYHHA